MTEAEWTSLHKRLLKVCARIGTLSFAMTPSWSKEQGFQDSLFGEMQEWGVRNGGLEEWLRENDWTIQVDESIWRAPEILFHVTWTGDSEVSVFGALELSTRIEAAIQTAEWILANKKQEQR